MQEIERAIAILTEAVEADSGSPYLLAQKEVEHGRYLVEHA